ncbi:PH domain-containing protein [Sphingomicrobium marinum]|uniref:PH domain-containing protein n=1 Tax=Sphingomicrobium marinum TaxID=1227950 RepID=UPI0022407CDA|nr:PH domain-containing protein [Sphingomicrobium marinum]
MSDAELTADTHAVAAVADTADVRRLHPLTIVTSLGGIIKSAWGAFAAGAYFIYSGQEWIAAALVGAVIFFNLVEPILRYFSFSYRVADDELEMHSGILNRNHRSIPFDRVQDVNIEQNPIARLVGLARVKLETGASASGGEEDGVIDSITLDRANDLRDLIRRHRAGVTAPTPAEAGAQPIVETADESEPVFSMDIKRLAQLSVFNFSLAIVGVLFGLAQTYGDVLGIDPFSQRFWRDMLSQSETLQGFVLANQFVTVIFGLLSFVFVGLLTGVIRTVPRDWGFRLNRTETGFRRRRGLFTLTDVVMPLKRVQAAIRATGPVRRAFGFAEMKLQSLARESAKVGDHLIAPLATQSETDAILEQMEWRPLEDSTDWQRPAKAYFWMGLLWLIPILALILGGLAVAATQREVPGWLSLLAIGIVAVMALGHYVDYRRRRHRIDGDRFLIRSGWWRQRLVILPLKNIQSADVAYNFISRAFGVADVKLGVAGGSGFSAHGVDSVPADDAYALRKKLLEEAA